SGALRTGQHRPATAALAVSLPRCAVKSRAFAWLFAGTAALIGAFMLLMLYDFGQGCDQAIYNLVGDGVAHGLAPYRDRWDMKPPGVFFVYALGRALFGTGDHGMRVFEIVCALAMTAGLCALSRRHLDDARAGLVCAGLALLNLVQLDYWHTG